MLENQKQHHGENPETILLDLLQKAQAGDAKAFRQLIETMRPRLEYWARSKRIPPADIPDIVQKTEIELSQHLDDIYPNDRALVSWLRTTLINRCTDHWRSQNAHPTQPIGDMEVPDPFPDQERRVIASDIIDKTITHPHLSKPDRAAAADMLKKGLSQAEIRQKKKLPKATASRQVKRIRDIISDL